MFERYTDEALLVLASARIEAIKLGRRVLSPEHLLLGLIKEQEGLVGVILRKWRVDPAGVRAAIERRVEMGGKVPTDIDIPLSEPSKRVLAAAREEAKSILHKNLGPEHLLLGLLRVQDTLAFEVLREIGMELLPVKTDLLLLCRSLAASERGPGRAGAREEWMLASTDVVAGARELARLRTRIQALLAAFSVPPAAAGARPYRLAVALIPLDPPKESGAPPGKAVGPVKPRGKQRVRPARRKPTRKRAK